MNRTLLRNARTPIARAVTTGLDRLEGARAILMEVREGTARRATNGWRSKWTQIDQLKSRIVALALQ
jgi:hypothetical protein